MTNIIQNYVWLEFFNFLNTPHEFVENYKFYLILRHIIIAQSHNPHLWQKKKKKKIQTQPLVF